MTASFISCDTQDLTLGERLQRLFAENDVTPFEVSLQTSIDETELSLWLDDDLSELPHEQLMVLAEYFGCDANWLQTGEPCVKEATSDIEDITKAPSFSHFEHKSIQELAEWIDAQNDGIAYWEVIKAMFAKEYPAFNLWLKERYSKQTSR